MKKRTISTLISATALALLAGTSAQANTFVESYTSADLIGNGEDSVYTTLGLGYDRGNIEGSIGAGYASEGDQAVVRGEVRYYNTLATDLIVEGEVEVLYFTDADQLNVVPQVRLRKYF